MTRFPFDIVAFDLDGTLLDTSRDLGVALNHSLEQFGRASVPLDDVKRLIGGGGRTMLNRALAEQGGSSDEEFEAMHRAFLTFYADNLSAHSRLFPGGEAMLDGLAERGVKLAVVTNKLETFALRILADLGLSQRFFTVLGGDTLGAGRAKPAPDLLNEMIARGGGGRTAYIGDTTYDTGASEAAGIPCVAVSFGFNDRPPHELGAAAVIDHYDELIPALEALGETV